MSINPHGPDWIELKTHIEERIAALQVGLEHWQMEWETEQKRGAIAELRRMLELVEPAPKTTTHAPDYSLRK